MCYGSGERGMHGASEDGILPVSFSEEPENCMTMLSAVAIALLTAGDPSAGATRREILDAIRSVESGGREYVPDGDGGRSIGPYQISRAYWEDALSFDQRIGGTYEDCRDRAYSERVIAAFMRRHVPAAWRARDAEVIARTHNGGPNGASEAATFPYWERVRAVLAARRSGR
jgi:hypothetical protein